MTFQQSKSGHRHCDEQNLSDNENFGGSNLVVPNALQVLLKIGNRQRQALVTAVAK